MVGLTQPQHTQDRQNIVQERATRECVPRIPVAQLGLSHQTEMQMAGSTKSTEGPRQRSDREGCDKTEKHLTRILNLSNSFTDNNNSYPEEHAGEYCKLVSIARV